MRRKAKPSRAAKKSSKPKKSGGSMNWGRARGLALPVLALVAVVGLGAGMTYGVDALDHEASVVMVSQPIEVELNHPRTRDGVDWVPPEQYGALVERARAALEGVDPLDVRSLRRVSELLGASGWFRENPQVRRTGAHSVAIEAAWRMPAAVVRSNGRDRLVSWDAIPMPMDFPIGATGAVTILGAGLLPLDEKSMLNRPWPGTDVQAALSLLRIVQQEEFRAHVAAIDVSGLSGKGGIVLITREETRVIWGAPPGVFRPGEVPDDVKLERLRDVYRKYGRIDAGGEVFEVNSTLPLRLPTDSLP